MNRKTLTNLYLGILLFLLCVTAVAISKKGFTSPKGTTKEAGDIGHNAPQKMSNNSSIEEWLGEGESLSDLIDGDYQYEGTDVRGWPIYQNKQIGFEIRIPRAWFCSGPALEPNSAHSVVCMSKKERYRYYAGKNVSSGLVMVSRPDEGPIVGSLHDKLKKMKDAGANIYTTSDHGNGESVIVEDRKSDTWDLYLKGSHWQFTKNSSMDSRIVLQSILRTFRLLGS